MRKINIRVPEEYQVLIKKNILEDISDYLNQKSYGSYFILTDEKVDRLYGDRFEAILKKTGKKIIKYLVSEGEDSKSLGVLEEVLEFMAEKQITRSDLLIAFGGGVVGDIGGFTAGVFQRGMDYIQVPTTLLAAVDSSVGGKTAINLKAGKNLVGLFKQPSAVICDPQLFKSLNTLDFSCGLAEIIKYSILFDEDLFERLQEPLSPDSDDLEETIEKCVKMKAKIVIEDEFDYGKRQLLNLGHTIGHAIEKLSQFKINHGHAVAMGIGIMARACERKGLSSKETTRQIEELLRVNSLPINTEYLPSELIRVCKKDKKRIGNSINIVIIKDIANCEILAVDFNELENIIELGVIDR